MPRPTTRCPEAAILIRQLSPQPGADVTRDSCSTTIRYVDASRLEHVEHRIADATGHTLHRNVRDCFTLADDAGQPAEAL